MALKRADFRALKLPSQPRATLLGAGVLRYSLGSFADGVLGQLSWKQQSDGGLDFSARDRRTTVVVGKTRGFGSDALEDIVHEAVHDRHRLAADASVGMDLLQHLVDVDRVALLSSALLLLVSRTHGLSLAGCLLRSFARWLGWHVDSFINKFAIGVVLYK